MEQRWRLRLYEVVQSLPVLFLGLALVYLGWVLHRANQVRVLFGHIRGDNVAASLEMIQAHPFLAH